MTSGEKRAPATAPGGVRRPTRLRRTWMANQREELLVPASSLLELSELLLQDARERGPETFVADLRKVCDAGRRLLAMVEVLLDPERPEVAEDEFAGHVRHDLRTPLAEVIGLCEIWLDEGGAQFLDSFLDDLRKIREQGKAILARLDDLLRFGRRPDSAAEIDLDGGGLTPPAGGRRPAAQKGTILVIEDNEIIRGLLARRLGRDGHTVTVAPDGQQGLTLARAQPFDLILLDVIMPGIDGLEVLARLKGDERLRHVPVIMISALHDIDSVARCIEMGAQDYLPKPFNTVLLQARVEACLEQKRLRDREQLYLNQVEQAAVRARLQLEQFFTRELYQELEARPDLLQPRDAEITVLFCDIRGFSRVSERLGPARTVEWVSDVMGELSECVLAHHGVVVEYVGDELMAMWGAPAELPDHPRHACAAAVAMLRRLPKLSRRWEPLVGEPTAVGIGLNTGVARVGNVGSRYKFKYGPLGNTVNLASRVQGATKYLGTRVILTRSTYQRLGAGFPARRLCRVRVVNIAEPVDLYELTAADDAAHDRLRRAYEQALDQFEAGQFRTAIRVLGNLLNEYLDDGPSPVLLARAVSHLKQEPGQFDPVWELPGK